MRFNFDEDFESVYLRESGFPHGFSPEDQAFVNLVETQKVIKHMVGKNVRMAGEFLTAIGLDSSDLYSIISVYAVYYTIKSPSKPVNYTLMMRFIDQRISYLMECFARKEKSHERVSFIGTEIDELTNKELFTTATPSYETVLIQAYENRMDKKIKKFRCLGKDYSSREQMLINLKAKLDADPKKYQRDLVYYAASKHVSEEVRKKARKYCKKYGIDYIEAAKKLFMSKDSENHDNHFDV
jgi:hypothetical protein